MAPNPAEEAAYLRGMRDALAGRPCASRPVDPRDMRAFPRLILAYDRGYGDGERSQRPHVPTLWETLEALAQEEEAETESN